MKLILCAALALASGMVSAEVNKCVDQEGHVLFTDAECPAATQQVAAQEPLVAPPAPRSRWADLPRPLIRKTVSLDAATLQAARHNLLLQDGQHKPRRLLTAR